MLNRLLIAHHGVVVRRCAIRTNWVVSPKPFSSFAHTLSKRNNQFGNLTWKSIFFSSATHNDHNAPSKMTQKDRKRATEFNFTALLVSRLRAFTTKVVYWRKKKATLQVQLHKDNSNFSRHNGFARGSTKEMETQKN